MTEQVVAYIGLGSNLNNPVQQVHAALLELHKSAKIILNRYSSLYQSEPMGPQDQPDYINAVARVTTTLSPDALLDVLQHLEVEHGRVRGRHWGERSLDLDLLLYGDLQMQTPRLTVPHPGIGERPFVLYPLQEVDPLLEIPGMGKLAALIKRCPPGRLLRLQEDD